MSNELNDDRDGRSSRSRDSGGRSSASSRQQEQEAQSQRAQTWVCPGCSMNNTARARTCDTCGTRKPAVAGAQGATSASTSSSSSSRKRVIDDDDDDDDDDEEEEEEEMSPLKRVKSSPQHFSEDTRDFESDLSNVAARLSDCRDTETRKELELMQCYLKVLRELSHNPKSQPFWMPVTADVAPDYRYVKCGRAEAPNVCLFKLFS
jgi:ribosomal protein L37AE/L43A